VRVCVCVCVCVCASLTHITTFALRVYVCMCALVCMHVCACPKSKHLLSKEEDGDKRYHCHP